MADIHFYFDPVCPFAWITSTWVRTVRDQREYGVEWRFISLRQLNAHIDDDSNFPPSHKASHTSGLHLLRVAAAVRDAEGVAAVDRLYEVLGTRIWEADPVDWEREIGDLAGWVRPVLAQAGFSEEYAAAADDMSWDATIQAETDEALSLVGKDLGTPIICFEPDAADGGTAFFGPVISRKPSATEAVELWELVVALARFPGFSELKRSLRELPQLLALGYDAQGDGMSER